VNESSNVPPTQVPASDAGQPVAPQDGSTPTPEQALDEAVSKPLELTPASSEPTPPDALASIPTTPTSVGEIITVPQDDQGRDPLVHDYLNRYRTVCAYHTISWSWVVIGFVIAVVSGFIGNSITGVVRVPPVTDWSLVLWLHAHFGNPTGVLGGMVVGSAVGALVGSIVNRKTASTAQEVWMAGFLAAGVYLLTYDWLICLSIASGLCCLIYLVAILFRGAALLLGGRAGIRHENPTEPPGGWPMYTVLVPLYREKNVAGSILTNLAKLDYPRDRLDVKFLLEADDPETLPALQAAGIPAWAEVVVVPLGQPKTKPRACNHGLMRAKGELLVIFDAEDRPAPDQLKQAAYAFTQIDERTVCLQAHLAYHNHRQNLLTRWFALEYNVWFRRYLGGLERMRVPIPLGGTSNHFRTATLRQLGGWDPFNVTEDCDLGVRLYQAGFRTRILDSVTWEEANSRVGNWIRQRSRWIKGYLVTHLVWCRRPLALVANLGPWGAFGFLLSVFCVSALSALNLVLWTVMGIYAALIAVDLSRGYDLVTLITTRPEVAAYDRVSWPMLFLNRGEDPYWSQLSLIFFVTSLCLIAGNFAFVIINAATGRRKDQKGLGLAALISPLYWILISIAAWKAVWQLIVKPHYWEKTVHGLDH
jgi:glycosyltransferase XagB